MLRHASATVLLALIAFAAEPALARELRVCADPNNLPFSNDKLEGLENRVVELIARDLGAEVRYTWFAQRRGFVRNTLNAEECDLVPGVAAGVETLAQTKPYYRSTYVFVTRADRHLDLHTLGDPRLKSLKVGVQLVGDDGGNTPPAHALAARGVVRNVRGYMLYGDYTRPNPPAAIVDAVARGEVDVALVWGPLAGYFADREPQPLAIAPVTPALDGPWPMVFDVAMGVRRRDKALKDEVDAALDRHRAEIQQILADYHVPLATGPAPRLPDAD